MPSPPPFHRRRHPRPTRNQRVARRTAQQAHSREAPRSANNSAFLELASLQFEALARQTANRRHSRSVSPPPRRRRSRSLSPLPHRSRSPATERRFTSDRRAPAASSLEHRTPARSNVNPLTITGCDPSPHQEAGATARPSPDAEESVIGWSDYDRERQNNFSHRTDSYRTVYNQQPSRR
jgi:hypothetical protein